MTDLSTDPATDPPATAPATAPADLGPGMTLAAVVTRLPGATRVLEGHGLDYCCKGGRPLGEACAAQGVDTNEVLAQLHDLAGDDGTPADWASMSPAELVVHLEATHHAYLHTELPRLSELCAKVASVHGTRHPELDDVRRLYEELRADLEPHLMKEERVLFPAIRALCDDDAAPAFHCGTLGSPISVMRFEHDRAGELLEGLRQVTGGYTTPADGCASYRALYEGLAELEADTHLHVHKENNVLFPAVLALESEQA